MAEVRAVRLVSDRLPHRVERGELAVGQRAHLAVLGLARIEKTYVASLKVIDVAAAKVMFREAEVLYRELPVLV